MSGDSGKKGVSRRDFSVMTAAGVAGLALTRAMQASGAEATAQSTDAKVAPAAAGEVKIPLRPLGKTGLNVSEISLGAMEVTDPAVIEKAIDDGINYIDTAASYQGGKDETMIGTIMPRRRNEIVLATKWSEDTKEGFLASLDRSLERLQTDHVDIIQYHGAKNAATVKSPELKEAFDIAKKAGKARFFGITTHSNQAAVIQACIEAGYVDSMLIAYNIGLDDKLTESVKNAREAGIGTVIMKPVQKADELKTSGGMTGYQMAIRWLLDKQFVDTVNVGMTNFAQLDENLKASKLKMTALDRLQAQRFAAACSISMCARCGKCGKSCKQSLDPAELVRAHMYAFDYKNVAKAREAFAEIGGAEMLAKCADCGACEKACPRNLNIRQRFKEVASLIV